MQVYRSEIKYQIDLTDYYRLTRRLAAVLHADAHNGATGYRVRSLYFDTLSDRDFIEKENGLNLRRKIRIRCYHPESGMAYLEMKQKQGARQRKRTLALKTEDARACFCGDYSGLLRYDSDFSAECFGLMQRDCYRPKAVIEYDRTAFIAQENNIRITFDRNIRATQSCFDLFDEHLLLKPVTEPFNVTLEVKYDGFLLSYIKDLLCDADVSPLSAGKYSAGRY